uniref:Uncharacterized protein n=1 Tax=Pararge aegeria TaxID=116150 RepID=S4NWL9_9NEOP
MAKINGDKRQILNICYYQFDPKILHCGSCRGKRGKFFSNKNILGSKRKQGCTGIYKNKKNCFCETVALLGAST